MKILDEEDLIDRVQSLDDLTSVALLQAVGRTLFKDPEVWRLMHSFDDPFILLPSAGRMGEERYEVLPNDRSIWLARELLAALVPCFAPVVARALEHLQRDELVGEAAIPQGLATDMIRLLFAACQRGFHQPWRRGEAERALEDDTGRLTNDTRGTKTIKIPMADRIDPLMEMRRIVIDPTVPLPRHGQHAKPHGGEQSETRTAWPHLKCDDAVVVGTPFDLEVGLRSEQDLQVGGLGSMSIPQRGCVLGVEILFDPKSFAMVGDQRQFTLDVYSAESHPVRTLKMVALKGKSHPDRRTLCAAYCVDGVLAGFAARGVDVFEILPAVPGPKVSKPFAGIDLSKFKTENEADLTIVVKRGDGAGSANLLFAAWSPHIDISVDETPPTSSLGSKPERFLEHILKAANTTSNTYQLFTTMKGIGRQTIATKLPPVITDALRKVIAATAPHLASVLIISDDPYVPWELAVLDLPIEGAAGDSSPFLGAQVALGRWVLPSADMPPPHPIGHLAVREEAVITATYQRVPNWKRLERAEEESATLLREWGGGSHAVEGTFDDVMNCLHGHPAVDLLHFALHGQFDLSGLQDGLVLIEKPADQSTLVKPTFLRPDDIASSVLDRSPFVFLNACQVGAAKEMLGDNSGMVQAFLFAGASAVVAPLWSVDDGEAQNLALEFYTRCWQGEPPAEILRCQRARFTESAARQGHSADCSPTNLAYQFFGHPRFTLERERIVPEARP
jgi:hypothetical protein